MFQKQNFPEKKPCDPRDQRDPVSFSRPGHIRDPILCICVYLCICDPETKFHKNTQRDPRDPVTQKQIFPKKTSRDPRDQRDPVTQKQNSTKKTNVIHVTSVYYRLPGHIRDPILCIHVTL